MILIEIFHADKIAVSIYFKKLAKSEKFIPSSINWTHGDGSDGYTRFSVALDVGDITIASLTLDGGAYINHPEEHVTFELSILGHDSKRRIRLMRLDWKSLKGGHSNHKRKCAGLWGGKRVPETHFHTFELNWVESEQRMKSGNLPCAEPINEQLLSFGDLREFVNIF